VVENDDAERRHFIRHSISYPLECEVIADEKKQNERTKTGNISEGGLLFLSVFEIPVNAKVVLKLPFKDKIYTIRAKVVHVKKDDDSTLYSVGVCFYDLSEAFKAKLIEQLYLIDEYRHLRSIELGYEISFEEASKDWIRKYSKHFSDMYW